MVKMILNGTLISVCDNKDFLNAGIKSLFNNILNCGLINDVEHFLWNGF